ncbi:MlaD family protein [Sphingomonas baiyangensis]|uniref:MCE family protein n=1 Tax=Sphingomonas baiyangensis TaxID=2572576 RepID=A0A4U1L4W8_9SPHN|nr:MlaD family protein [Sphingomonas baiyangensis]TKD51977.1 MCE family protein [Sphingomonas baiyangensis]
METRSNHVLVGAVVLILLAMLALFTVWLARLSGGGEKQYDIFFKQAIDGINVGSPVAFSGVPSGQVSEIALFKPDPQFVRVRIRVKDDVPILQGTTATIQGIGFTGVSQIALDGAVRGAPPIRCPDGDTSNDCPFGVPVIPPRQGGLGAILNSAPQLLERITTLTERLTELLSDRNQNSIAGILESTNRLADALADRGPEIAATMAETRIAIQKAGVAAEQIGQLAGTTNSVLANDVQPAMRNLNQAIAAAEKSANTLNAAIGDARPGLQAFSKQTVPEVGQLVSDLRVLTESLADVAERVNRGGAGSLVGSPKLPDYEPE